MSAGDRWPCLRESADGLELDLRVVPGSAREGLDGLWQGPGETRLKLRVSAPPVEGKANDAVVKWCAEAFGVRRNQIELVRGDKGRTKTVRIEGISREEAARVLDNRSSSA